VVEDDKDASRLGFEVRARGWKAFATLEHATTGRLMTVRCEAPPKEGADREEEVVFDLLFAPGGIEREVVAAATSAQVAKDVTAPVCQLADVRRPQVIIDLRGLIGAATHAESDVARRLVGLITERGYDRGNDLRGDLEKLIVENPQD
jgi:hypothetical protein